MTGNVCYRWGRRTMQKVCSGRLICHDTLAIAPTMILLFIELTAFYNDVAI
jgi:hypothetical protein